MGFLLVLGILQVLGCGQGVLLHGLHTVQLVLIKLGNSKLRKMNAYQYMSVSKCNGKMLEGLIRLALK